MHQNKWGMPGSWRWAAVAWGAVVVMGASASCLPAQETPDTKPPAAVETEPADAPPAAEPVLSESEKQIHQAIESYVAAFNAGDAAKLAGHWTPEGEFVTPAQVSLHGREELTKAFTGYFEKSPGATLQLVGTEVTLLSPAVARESGFAVVTAGDEEASETAYQAIHVKTSEGWKIDSIREDELPTPPPSHYEELQALEWMLGTWSNDAAGSSIVAHCRWTTNANFLVRTYKVFIEDRVDFEGTQIIGWDPSVQTIRSWAFDSDGGFAAGRWSNNGDRWTVQSLNVLPDGRKASSTNLYDVLDEDHVQFQSIGRQVDGELLPSIKPVILTRTAE
ncbi:YybH family protein [Lignipirellula cremea]|uniref:SnoaL-like domain protein n=1 Tax=Lignipirellula cremea TaxID=2528010 RepID=A0A518DSK0_9BACT|nr:SgcJ/EcaC family oxidoreductase [Lignipirellula cremea]QDU94821.1 SnoaL-like domain protein [Lignipirellula cremea]